MSDANKCDSCGAFYERVVGCVVIQHYEVIVDESDGEEVVEQGSADLCPPCAEGFLKQINSKIGYQENGK